MRIWIPIVAVVLVAGCEPAVAGEIDMRLVSGVGAGRMQASADTNVGVTRSIGLRREDTGAMVFCAAALAGEIVDVETDSMDNPGVEVLVRGYSFTGAECTGTESVPSSDAFRVPFGPPGAPLLLEYVPSAAPS